MRTPSFRLNRHYTIRYIQVAYDNRYYKIINTSAGCEPITTLIPHSDEALIDLMVTGVASNMPAELKNDLYQRYDKFRAKVEKKNEELDKTDQ